MAWSIWPPTSSKKGRQVVVKILAPHWTDDTDAVARFEREAELMGKLDHPNVVTMFEHGRHGGSTYIVMEFLDGEPLRRYLNRCGHLSFDAFIPIASQILAGVGYVHARDTMLRDIKPPNIMLCERDGKANHVKLLRLRFGQADRGSQRDHQGARDRHGGLPRARADQGGAGRCPRRCVRARDPLLHPADRPIADRRRKRRRDPVQPRARHAQVAAGDAALGARCARLSDRPGAPVLGQRPGRAPPRRQ